MYQKSVQKINESHGLKTSNIEDNEKISVKEDINLSQMYLYKIRSDSMELSVNGQDIES
jgi:hypothetical protein